MRGYFTGLAKQTGVEIGASNSFAGPRPGPLPGARIGGAGAPLHVETVDLVDSMSPAYAAKQVSAADVPNPSIASSSDKQRAQPSETNSLKEVPTRSFTLEQRSKREPDVPGLSTKALETQSGAKGGVIRVGEGGSSFEQKPAPQPDASTEVADAITRHETSIPSDYVEGIREWLASTPSRSEDIKTRSAADQESFTTREQTDWSSHSNSLDRDSAPQNDIQEFSLSIGSISIVVEEPAQQRKQQQSNSAQPPESGSVAAQPRARDAFALSRSYFRGF